MYDICHCNCVHYTLHTEYSILHVCVYVYMCMYTCMYVYMCVCMYVCMYVRVHVCMYVCMYACMYVFIHSHITEIYIAPLQSYYSEALPTIARLKRRVFRLE